MVRLKHSSPADWHLRPAALNISSLTDDVVRRVLLLVPQHDRMTNVPLVCKRWATLVGDPSAWPHIVFSAGLMRPNGELTANSLARLRWLQRHSSGVEELILQSGRTRFTQQAPRENDMVETVLLAMAPATRLRQLRIPLLPPSYLNVNSLVTATLMSGLTRLAVAELRPEPPDSHTLDALFAGLPALESVTLHFRPFNDVRQEEGQPFPMALLRCTRLTSLDFSLYTISGVSNALDFGGLPDGISALQRLECLLLDDCLTQQLNSNVSRLTRLSSLAVAFRALEHPAVAQALPPVLPMSLHALDVLSSSFSHVTALTGLRRLKLHAAQMEAAGEQLRQLSTLQLTSLHLMSFESMDLALIAGCTGLRELSVMDTPIRVPQLAALRLPQLTALCLKEAWVPRGQWSASLLLSALITAMPRLMVLDASYMGSVLYFSTADAGKFASLPCLREVNVAGSLPQGNAMDVIQQVIELQRLWPRISWVVHVADCSTISV